MRRAGGGGDAGLRSEDPGLSSRRKVISDLAAAILRYEQDRSLARSEGGAARAAILRNYEWDTKGVQMNDCYREALSVYREQELLHHRKSVIPERAA